MDGIRCRIGIVIGRQKKEYLKGGKRSKGLKEESPPYPSFRSEILQTRAISIMPTRSVKGKREEV